MKLPTSSPAEEFKCAKVGLDMTLTESENDTVRNAAPTISRVGVETNRGSPTDTVCTKTC